MPGVFAPLALRGDKLVPDLAKKGIYLSRILNSSITYTAFNMRDPVVGGFTKEKVALRRAIVMAYSNEAEIEIIRKGQAAPLQMPIPPGVAGYSPGYRSSIGHDPAAANKLLDQMGYRRSADGYRRMPDGRELLIRYSSPTEATGSSRRCSVAARATAPIPIGFGQALPGRINGEVHPVFLRC